MRQGLLVVGIGASAGLAASALAGRAIAGILFGVTPLDPISIAFVVAVLGSAATLANVIPAARAARTDPQVVLRGD